MQRPTNRMANTKIEGDCKRFLKNDLCVIGIRRNLNVNAVAEDSQLCYEYITVAIGQSSVQEFSPPFVSLGGDGKLKIDCKP